MDGEMDTWMRYVGLYRSIKWGRRSEKGDEEVYRRKKEKFKGHLRDYTKA